MPSLRLLVLLTFRALSWLTTGRAAPRCFGDVYTMMTVAADYPHSQPHCGDAAGALRYTRGRLFGEKSLWRSGPSAEGQLRRRGIGFFWRHGGLQDQGAEHSKGGGIPQQSSLRVLDRSATRRALQRWAFAFPAQLGKTRAAATNTMTPGAL